MLGQDAPGRNVLPRSRKTRAVLAVLLFGGTRQVLRTELTGLLWSRREREQARASLRQSVHELRIALGPAGRLLRAIALISGYQMISCGLMLVRWRRRRFRNRKPWSCFGGRSWMILPGSILHSMSGERTSTNA